MRYPQAHAKVADLSTLFINFHHILNEYRPHQARESAMALMQSRLDQMRDETAAVRAQVDKTKRVLEGLTSIEVPHMPAALASRNSDDEDALEADESARDEELVDAADACLA